MSKSVVRIFVTLVVFICIVSSQIMTGQANADSSIKVKINDKLVDFYAQPININGTILVDITPIMKVLGYTSMRVSRYTIEVNIDHEFYFFFELNNTTAVINGSDVRLSVAPKSVGNHVMIPLDIVVEALGLIYQWEESTNTVIISSHTIDSMIKEIKTTDTSNMQYSGTLINGKRNGSGTLMKGSKLWYEGDFLNGQISGNGTFYHNGKPFYKGEVNNQVIDVKGTFYSKDGTILYSGDHTRGVMNGYGKTYYSKIYGENQLEYEGYFKNGLRNGVGKLNNPSGRLWYDGSWKDGQFHGFGKRYINGHLQYEGQWINQAYSGNGKEYSFTDGSLKYEGNFEKDLYQGSGSLYYSNGYKFVGVFEKGTIVKGEFFQKVKSEYIKAPETSNGHGTKLYSDGHFYIGELKNGNATDKGKYYNYNGELMYEGFFLNDQFSGKGTMITEYGIKFVGEFKEGQLLYGREYKNDELQYEGSFQESKYNGSGKLYDSGKLQVDGEFKDGQLLYGREYKNDELQYEGNFHESEYDGSGKLYESGRLKVDGEFKNGWPNGNIKIFYSDGIVGFEGTVNEMIKEGNGTWYHPNGSKKFEGSFSTGMYEGEGKIYNEQEKLLYSGNFSSGLKEGKGTLYFLNGYRFEGEFYNDGMKYGTYFDSDGKEVNVNNVKNGHGILLYGNSDAYIGEIMNSDLHGKGQSYQSNGFKYVGNFVNGEADGDGELYRSDGSLFYKGQFKEGYHHGSGAIYNHTNNAIATGQFVRGSLMKNELIAVSKDESIAINYLRDSISFIVIDGSDSNYDISNEAHMVLTLKTDKDYEKFMSISHTGKVQLINSYVQQHWKEFFGSESCFIEVKHKGNIIIDSTITYQMSNDKVLLDYYPF